VTRSVLAIDPGREKCGLALVTDEGVRFRAVVPTVEIGLTCHYLLQEHPAVELIIGEGTGTSAVVAALRKVVPDVAITPVSEEHSTLRGRARYFADHPGSWVQRLLPQGLRVPPRPVDDYAAVVLAEEFLQRATT
jgi:hypothetical protein